MPPLPPGQPLLERWREISLRGRKPAIYDTEGRVMLNFAGIEERAEYWATHFKDLPRGGVVALKICNHPDWPSIFLALLRAGLILLPMDQSLPRESMQSALQLTGAVAVIENGFEALQPAKSHVWNDTVLLKMTSGSTGEPRLIRFAATQLLADADQIVQAMGLRPDDLNYGAIPFSHSYGFSNLLTPLLAHGIPLVVARDIFPRALLEGLRQSRATILPGIPLIYQTLAGLEDAIWPETVRLCISAGAPLPLRIIEHFHQRFGRKIHSFYGASECGGICYDASDHLGIPEGFVGSPLQGVVVEWNSESSRIQIGGPAVSDDYFPFSEPEVLGNGIFHPADLLEPIGEGFRIVGRLSDFINVAGKKVNPREVEEVIARHPGVAEVVVFGIASPTRGQSVIAAVRSSADDAPLPASAILQYCRKNLAAWQVPQTIWFPGSIGTNGRGKINRLDLAQRFMAEISEEFTPKA